MGRRIASRISGLSVQGKLRIALYSNDVKAVVLYCAVCGSKSAQVYAQHQATTLASVPIVFTRKR